MISADRVPRLFLPVEQFQDNSVTLNKTQEHYLCRVLRRKPGDTFVALNGTGSSWLCQLSTRASAERIENYPAVPPLKPQLRIGLSLCKGARFESAIEKLAELGVAEVIPLCCERTERKLPSESKFARWTDIALAASALGGRLIPLIVQAPRALEALLEQSQNEIAYCHPQGERASQFFHQKRDSITLLIGPEGGFSPKEVSQLSSRGKKVDLGPLNLRVETAAVAAATLCLHLSI